MEPAAARPGLRSEEARRLLAAVGANTLGTERRAAWWRTLGDVLREPMVLLLLACAAVYVAFGDLSEALILAASVVLVVLISLLQRARRSVRCRP